MPICQKWTLLLLSTAIYWAKFSRSALRLGTASRWCSLITNRKTFFSNLIQRNNHEKTRYDFDFIHDKDIHSFTQHQVQYLQSIICYDTKWPQVACHNETPQHGWAFASLETVFTPETTDNTWASPLVMKPRGAERISSIFNSVRQGKRRALIKAEVPPWEIHTHEPRTHGMTSFSTSPRQPTLDSHKEFGLQWKE